MYIYVYIYIYIYIYKCIYIYIYLYKCIQIYINVYNIYKYVKTPTFGQWAEGEEPHTRPTRAVTKYGHALRVSPKAAYVLTDPPQSLDLVQETIVTREVTVRSGEKTYNKYHMDGLVAVKNVNSR